MFSKEQIHQYVVEHFDTSAFDLCEYPLLSGTPCFTFRANDQYFFLKLFPAGSANEVRFENDLLFFLNASSNFSGKVPNVKKTFNQQDIIFVVYDFIDAHPLKGIDLNDGLLRKIAQLHSALHEYCVNFKSAGERVRVDLFDLSFIENLRQKSKIEKDIYEYVSISSGLFKSKHARLPKTIIHEDLSIGNILLQKGDPIFIDFGESHYGYRISDIAILITELFIDGPVPQFIQIERYLHFYNQYSHTQLSSDERDVLAFSIMRRALFMQNYYLESIKDFTEDYYDRSVSKVNNLWTNMREIERVCSNS